jgi:glycolate oxidase FAD binding subunit
MTPIIAPVTPAELAETLRSVPKAIVVGAGTKPRLSQAGGGFARISTTQLRGIVEYEPSEFTFTALAGTPVKEIVAELASRGQYLPFDPMLAQAGATLGGTIASGLSGPGRFRFGGLRDFILGVQFVDGEGRLLRAGGKVVKNAAGFDLPKFFVGSAGRFGVLTEITFKVFPKPAAARTLRLEAKEAGEKASLLTRLASGRWEFDALDAPVEESAVYARIAGPEAALDALAKDVLGSHAGAVLTSGDGAYLWQSVVGLSWAHTGGTLVKVVLTPTRVPEFIGRVRAQAGARGWVSAGGNVGFISVAAGTELPKLDWPAVTLRGDAALWPGAKPRFEVMAKVKAALDPGNRFPGLDE